MGGFFTAEKQKIFLKNEYFIQNIEKVAITFLNHYHP